MSADPSSNRVFIPDLPTTAAPRVPKDGAFHISGATMGTNWSVRGFSDVDAKTLECAVESALQSVVSEMSQWEPDSNISRFNALPGGGVAQLPPAFRDVLACALEVAAETDGAFDPTLGALVDMWGFGPRTINAPPRQDEIDAALAASGWRKLSFDAAAGALTQPGGLRLDFSGVAKGYAVDCVARRLRESGANSFLVEIGGEVRGHGVKPDGQPWWVEIERPPELATQPIVAALYNVSAATSGDYRRHAWIDGRRISHTIDPATGWPLLTPIAAVTVLTMDCMRADAYATALAILGVEAGLAFADRRDLAALFTLRGESGAREVMSKAFARGLS